MKLSVRLALTLLVLALIVTSFAVWGAIRLVDRTFSASHAQEARRLDRHWAELVTALARDIGDAARILVLVEGPLSVRLGIWRKGELDAVALLDPVTGRIRECVGAAPDPADLAALSRAAPGAPGLVRGGGGLMLGVIAREPGRRATVFAARRLDRAKLARLGELLDARVDLAVAGGGAGDPSPPDSVPITVLRNTAAGVPVALVLHLPATEALKVRRDGLHMIAAAGGAIAVVTAVFFGWFIRELRLTQERMIHSAKLSSVGQLVAGVSHELNNPLLGVLGHSEYLTGKLRPGDPGHEEVGLIYRESLRMKRLLGDLRGLVSPGGGEPTSVQLDAVAGEVAALVRHEAGRLGVGCRAEPPAEPVMVHGVADRIRQALLNLVFNALQASSAGGEVVIRALPAGAGARHARLVVQDGGTGIERAMLARIREPFMTTRPGRLGLGLAICQDVAAQHGGVLSVESAPGRGTTVTLSLRAEAA